MHMFFNSDLLPEYACPNESYCDIARIASQKEKKKIVNANLQ